MLKLWEHPLSPYVHKVKIALYEKNIPFDVAMPNAFAGGSTDYGQTNPRLEVPALEDGALKLFDSTIILQYIEDKWPTPTLLPASPADRARVRMIEEVCDTTYEAINWGVMEIRIFKRASGALADSIIKRADQQIAGVQAWLERHLGNQPWFNGASFGYGDLCVVPFVAGSVAWGIKPKSARLGEWLVRASERDSIKKTMAASQQSMGGVEQLPQLIESGAFVRQYRDHRLDWMMRSGGHEIVAAGMSKKNIRFSSEIS